MIRLENLTKIFTLEGRSKVIVKDVNIEFRSGLSVALLGRNGAGKSTLLQMIAGNLAPTSGRIVSTGTISWPVGFAGSFHPELSGAQNTRFVARIYGVDTDELVRFVENFAGLGQHFHLPFRTYSSGMHMRLGFAVSTTVPADIILMDEWLSVGDSDFMLKAERRLQKYIEKSSILVIASHSENLISKLTNQVIRLEHQEW